MKRDRYPFNGKRYIRNTNKNEVHDLEKEQTGDGKCQIDEIKNDHIVTFSPDTLEEAERRKFDHCHWCIGGSKY